MSLPGASARFVANQFRLLTNPSCVRTCGGLTQDSTLRVNAYLATHVLSQGACKIFACEFPR
jgi:hypothetical protein